MIAVIMKLVMLMIFYLGFTLRLRPPSLILSNDDDDDEILLRKNVRMPFNRPTLPILSSATDNDDFLTVKPILNSAAAVSDDDNHLP